ncbi:MAG TPA: hypothetical protein PLP95_07055, partial [Microthrixaceae bacterium]|nr:hypothetical protein [Microthrixaceae bacterium]
QPMACAMGTSSRPTLRFASAHARLTCASARISSEWIGWPRSWKFRDERRVDFAYVGPDAAGLSVIVGTEDNPSKPDPNPESLTIAPSARDLISRPVSRRILDVGFGRW